MAKIRCSNCEKSVNYREKNGKVFNNKICKATGENITGKKFYIIKKCNEFLPRKEYIYQFENTIDKAMEIIEKGKRIRDIIEPI